MAELVYEDGRLLFTKEMKEEYTILAPQMMPVHFKFLKHVFEIEGYKLEILETTHRAIVSEGLKYVHNDTCYPALLVTGQMIDAVKSGKYDPNKVALMIMQTGGGCRASNYIHLIRKALKRAGLEHIPVVSLNLSGLEKNPGFELNINMIRCAIKSMVYGDMLMMLANQCRPYEVEEGSTDKLIDSWVERLAAEFKVRGKMAEKNVRKNLELIAEDFANLPVKRVPKIKVGIVGEIYVKFAPLGNNNLEDFLMSEGIEPVIPGVMDFFIFKIDNRIVDVNIYGGSRIKKIAASVLKDYAKKYQSALIEVVSKYPQFRTPVEFEKIKELIDGYLGHGNKMGEGWLLPGEMLELVHSGIHNIICTQPFGCLPNHTTGKGMMKKIKEKHPEANIVAIDYDPGATRINQENRIKLMLSNAKEE